MTEDPEVQIENWGPSMGLVSKAIALSTVLVRQEDHWGLSSSSGMQRLPQGRSPSVLVLLNHCTSKPS